MRVIVTRPQAQSEPLLAALRAEGFEPVACPVIATETIDDGPIDTTGYDWVIVTSANGAAELGARRTGVLPRSQRRSHQARGSVRAGEGHLPANRASLGDLCSAGRPRTHVRRDLTRDGRVQASLHGG